MSFRPPRRNAAPVPGRTGRGFTQRSLARSKLRVTLGQVFSLILVMAAEVHPQGYAPDVAPTRMAPADGLAVTLYAAEPDVRQPILVKFDDRGRLWTIQYLQYPNPAGLERVRVDRFSRTVYDRVPEPPPKGPRGADRITICEDTDGDGRADHFRDFLTGLNLCTGLAFGHGGVYVLQAPYLLYYPDRDRNDVPDADPQVLLEGFGMEDAQSLANHLTWGPDGWLYGVTGSTTTNFIRGIEFQQAVWRFDPVSNRFELFCEGGGNLFGLTFDREGNLFFSSNGNDLAYHGVQGAYFRKNFGKHGPLHNPFTYGFFEHMPYDTDVAGPRPGGTIYLADVLPERFRGSFLCCDFLQHSASWWRLARRGSTFEAKYGGRLLDAQDRWFCAPDLCQGPDGAVYVCDFNDQRTAHPDPDANWDRSNGRIYRIAPAESKPPQRFDLARSTSAELIDLLEHPNGWFADQARCQLAARRDPSTYPRLAALARRVDNANLALQGLWGLHAAGGFDQAIAVELLRHPSDSVRAWTVRLLGDSQAVSPELARLLVELAADEPGASVRCQLAATARRLPGDQGLPIVERLSEREVERDDPYLPLMLWWAVEARALTDSDRLVRFFGRRESWEDLGRRENVLRLVRRLAAEGTSAGYASCERLLATSPKQHQAEALASLDRGLAERSVAPGGMGTVGLYDAVAIPNAPDTTTRSRRFEPLTAGLANAIAAFWHSDSEDLSRLRLAMRAAIPGASSKALAEAANPSTKPDRRVELLGLLADLGDASSNDVALRLLHSGQNPQVLVAALDVLAQHTDDRAATTLIDWLSKAPEELRPKVRAVLLSRPASARAFLNQVDQGAISAADVPVNELRIVALHKDQELDALVRKHWGTIRAGTAEEKLAEIRRLNNDLRAGSGDRGRGETLFRKLCATCHKLFGQGGEIGPDLTGVARDDTTALLASLVDPSAVVRAPYLQHLAVTTDGRVLSGLLAEQDGATITLIDAQGLRTSLPRDNVEELAELTTSIMPEGLLNTLTPQEVRDLIRYLQDRPSP